MSVTGEELPHYYVRTTEGALPTVETWSTQRLSFEPRARHAAWRKELGGAVARLEAPPGQFLHAVYGSSTQDFFDVENVLFNNVDTSRFAHAARFGIRFERAYSLPAVCPRPLVGSALHYHHYFFSDPSSGFRYLTPGRVLATWRTAAGPRQMLEHCASVWYAMKTALLATSAQPSAPPARFGLLITIHAPADGGIRLDATLKPVFDGVISAFHQPNGTDEREVSDRVAAKLNISPEVVVNLLRSDSGTVLGVRRVVCPHGAGVK